MSLININNAHSIHVVPATISLFSLVHGTRELDVYATPEEIQLAVLYLSHGTSRAQAVRAVASLIEALLQHGERTLYSIASILNNEAFKETRIEAEVSTADVRRPLMIKTTWQEAAS